MPYHGNCCTCALTLCLCIFGTMLAGTGVSLVLNYEIFDGNSTLPRTFPPGDWNGTVGIVLTGIGSFMFFTGIFLVLCCLTIGIKLNEKCVKKSKTYERFVDEDGVPETQEKVPPTDEYGDLGVYDIGNKTATPPHDCAYDVTFSEDIVVSTKDNDIKGQQEQFQKTDQILTGTTKDSNSNQTNLLTPFPDETNSTETTDECKESGLRVDYPSVVLRDRPAEKSRRVVFQV